MNLRDSLNQYYYDMTVSDLRQLNRTGGGALSYHSMMYLDIISYQSASGLCTVSTLAETLGISRSAVTIKVGELSRQGLLVKTQGKEDRRVFSLTVSETVQDALSAYDRPFERAARRIEQHYSREEIESFCEILRTFSTEFCKGF